MKKIVISLVAVLLTLSLFAFVACDKPADDNTPTSKGTLTFVMPDGTPALAAAKLLGTTEIGGYTVNTEIVAAKTPKKYTKEHHTQGTKNPDLRTQQPKPCKNHALYYK